MEKWALYAFASMVFADLTSVNRQDFVAATPRPQTKSSDPNSRWNVGRNVGRNETRAARARVCLMIGGVDGTRTRDPRRDRPDSGASNGAGFRAISYSKFPKIRAGFTRDVRGSCQSSWLAPVPPSDPFSPAPRDQGSDPMVVDESSYFGRRDAQRIRMRRVDQHVVLLDDDD